MSKVLLVRHAQSEWNAAGRWQGWADPPLSTLGRQQAVQAGNLLRRDAEPIGRAVSSDLDRARLTAQIIAGLAGTPELAARQPQVEEISGLRELDVGRWSGLTREQIATEWPETLAEWERGTLTAAPGGEERNHFDRRVREAMTRVLADDADRALLVVTHGGVVRSVGRWLGAPEAPVFHIAGFWIDYDAGRPAISATVDLGRPDSTGDGLGANGPAQSETVPGRVPDDSADAR